MIGGKIHRLDLATTNWMGDWLLILLNIEMFCLALAKPNKAKNKTKKPPNNTNPTNEEMKTKLKTKSKTT